MFIIKYLLTNIYVRYILSSTSRTKERFHLNTNLARIKKISSLLSIIIIIVISALTLAILVQGLAIWGLRLDSAGIITMAFSSLEVPKPVMDVIRTGIDLPLNELKIEFFTNMIKQSLMIGMLVLSHRIFRDFNRSHTPFSSLQTKRLKNIAILMLIYGIVPMILEGVLLNLYAPQSELYGAFEFSNLFFALIFYCLSLIFEYGRVLQQQSDETI